MLSLTRLFYLGFLLFLIHSNQVCSQSTVEARPVTIPILESNNKATFSLPLNTNSFVLTVDSFVDFFTIDLDKYRWSIMKYNNEKVISNYRFSPGNKIEFTQLQLSNGYCNCIHCSSGKRIISKFDKYKIVIEQNVGDETIVGKVELIKKELPAWVTKKHKAGDTFEISNITFYPNKAKFMKASEADLLNLFTLLKTQPDLIVSVKGHVNAPKENNNSQYQKLSENRAKNIVKFLVQKGISAKRLSSVGFGNSKMLYQKPKNEEEIRANRRVEITVL